MPQGYVTISEARARLGLSDPAFRRRLRAGVLPTYRNPKDWRSRLVSVEDLERYVTVPTPIAPTKKEGAAA